MSSTFPLSQLLRLIIWALVFTLHREKGFLISLQTAVNPNAADEVSNTDEIQKM